MAVKTYGSVSDAREELVKEYASVNNTRKELKKVYGSVNNQRKLIHTSTPPTPPVVPYGIVYYKVDPSDATVLSVDLQSVAEFNSLCSYSNTWTASVGGGSVTVSNRNNPNVIVGITIGSNITAINNSFLNYCTSFNQALNIPSTITSIGDDFLSNCSSFNQLLTIENGVTTIGDYFLYRCSSFRQPLTLPNSVTSIGEEFLAYCTAFNQTLTLPSGLTSISDYFLELCGVFNQSLALPNTVTSIGTGFLKDCHAFNQPLTLPSGLLSLGVGFLSSCFNFNQPLSLPSSITSMRAILSNCYNMVSTVDVGSLAATVVTETGNWCFSSDSNDKPCYTTGITIAGANRAAWLAKFPDRATTPFRKLLDAGY